MWKALGLCACGVVAYPTYMVCNDPRFEQGSKMMSAEVQTTNLDLEVTQRSYTHGSSVTIRFSDIYQKNSDVMVAARALPKLGYVGDYGTFSNLAGSMTKAEGGTCPNTVVSTDLPERAESLTWTAGQGTYGDVDIVFLWGTYGDMVRTVVTLSGPPIPSYPPSLMMANRTAAVPLLVDQGLHIANTSRQQTSVTPASGACVAPEDGSFNSPNAPVVLQKLQSKRGPTREITFPSGGCLSCREDHLDDCVSARVDCPKEPGLLAKESLFSTEDCSGDGVVSWLPTDFVHCPGPEHYSPDKLDLERFVIKLQRDHAQYFTDETTTRAAIAEYRRMLHVIQRFPDAPAVPSKLVDLVWHEHILDTQTYKGDSQRLFGKFVHHAPAFGDNEDVEVLAEKQEMQQQQLEMFKKYVELFKQPPDASIWPAARQPGHPQMGRDRLPDCCKAECAKVDCVTCIGCNAVDCGKLKEEQKSPVLRHALPEHFAGYVPLPASLREQEPATQRRYLCQVAPYDGMTFSWTISGSYIYMEHSLQTRVAETWHGIGFSDVAPYDMSYADYMVSFFGGNYTGVRDLYKYDAGNHYPCFDVLGQCSENGVPGTNDIIDPVATRENGVSTSTWARALIPEDFKDSPITAETKKVLFAHGTDDQFTYHTVDHKATCDMNFYTAAFSCNAKRLV